MAEDWSIQIPLSSLVALQGLPSEMEALEKEMLLLRRDVEALWCLYSQILQNISDYKREDKH